MISRKYIMDHIDNIYEEVNGLCLRVAALERKEFDRDIKKLNKKPATKKAGTKPAKKVAKKK